MRKKLIAVAAAVVALASTPAVAMADSGGAGGLQASIQDAVHAQVSAALSATTQTPVNANTPVTVAAGDLASAFWFAELGPEPTFPAAIVTGALPFTGVCFVAASAADS